MTTLPCGCGLNEACAHYGVFVTPTVLELAGGQRGPDYLKAWLERVAAGGKPAVSRPSTGAAVSVAVPVEQWPRLLRWVARRRQLGDTGVGDTIHRALGGDAVPKLLHRLGINCACADRVAWLNAHFPYAPENVP